MFEIRSVSKKYGDAYALRDISVRIGKGLNFIIGASGSGKTTLLKIMSGMEQDFDGDVFYGGHSLKLLSEQEKSYFYCNTFGFVWQDFNLLEELTVLENVMLPQYLKQGQDKKAAMKVLSELKISELAEQKAGKLSGGQKQRVAIARELIKNPEVIIADEPTSALDAYSAKMTMEILRDISKGRTVIIVTHDTSLIDQNSKVHELYKAELISDSHEDRSNCGKANGHQTHAYKRKHKHALTFGNAWRLATKSAKSKLGRFLTTSMSLLVASTLLMVTFSGAISGSSQSVFEDLFATYGESILDINVVGSFMSAGNTDGNKNEGPNANVSQAIDGLFDAYKNDGRVAYVAFTQWFNDIKITVDGKVLEIENSSTVPFINKLNAGAMPNANGNEVVVPHSFVERLGMTDKEALGKVITFNATINNRNSGDNVAMPVNATVKIVGVVDTSLKQQNEGQMFEFSVDDSFFFSQSALRAMRGQAMLENRDGDFTIRTKTPRDLIAIKDELNAKGIVPLGRFELIEDVARLSNQTSKQSSLAITAIGILSVVMVLVVAVITAFTRKREYAIYRVSGYSRGHLTMMTAAEFMIASMVSVIAFLSVSPLTNMATTWFWNVNILNKKMLISGVLLALAMGMLACMITALITRTVSISHSLKTGER